MRHVVALLAAVIVSCSTLRRDDGSGGDAVEARAPAGESCPLRRALTGSVVYDPHFETLVHAPHSGVLTSVVAKPDDRVDARAVLAEVIHSGKRSEVRAPVAGVVTRVAAVSGAFIREGDTPFVLADPARLAVRIDGLPMSIRRMAKLEIAVAGAAPVVVQRMLGDTASMTLPITDAAVSLGATAHVIVDCST